MPFQTGIIDRWRQRLSQCLLDPRFDHVYVIRQDAASGYRQP
jgi:hypothetical protein